MGRGGKGGGGAEVRPGTGALEQNDKDLSSLDESKERRGFAVQTG